MKPLHTILMTAVFTLVFVAGQALAVEGGTFLNQDVLREKPKANAKVLADVAKGTKAQIVAQKGNWFRVVIDGKWTGWVPVQSLRRHDATFGSGVGTVNSIDGIPTDAFGSGAPSMKAAPSTGGKK